MAGIVALTCHLVNPLHQPPVLHLNMQYICHRRSLTPNLASSDLRRLIVASIVNGFAIDMVNTMVVLICTPAVPRIDDNHDCWGSMATICGFNRDGLNPKVSPKNELCITHHKRGLQVNAGWKYKDSQHRHFRFRYFFVLVAAELIISLEMSLPVVDIGSAEMSDRGIVYCVCVLGASLESSTSGGIRGTKQHGISWRGIRKGCKAVTWCLLGVRVVVVDRPSSSIWCFWAVCGWWITISGLGGDSDLPT